jgi:glutathione S-transferase
MYTVYGLPSTMGAKLFKVLLMAEELGLDYRVVTADFRQPEARRPAWRDLFFDLHPFVTGKTPVLDHDGHFVLESHAIIRYLAAINGSAFYPQAPRERTRTDQWVDYFSLLAGRWTTAIWFHNCKAPPELRERSERIVREATESLMVDMPAVERQLATQPWFGGSSPSIADVNAYALMRRYREAGLSFGDFPRFRRYLEAYAARPATTRALARERAMEG